MELAEKKKRIEYIDIAKGITIILVIIGHSLNDGILRQYIYSFHMPLFYILNGYFFKKQENKKIVEKGIKRLLLPYLITSLIILGVYVFKAIIKQENVIQILIDWGSAIIYGSGEDRVFLGISIRAIGTIWFLFSLFWTQILFNCFLSIKKKKIKIIFLFVSTLIGFILPNYIWLPFSIETALIAILFLYIGYLFRKKKIFDKNISLKYKLIVFMGWIIGAFFCNTLVVNNYYNLYYVNIIVGVCGSYLLIEISKIIDAHTKQIKKAFKWCGENSLYILCVHAAEGRGIISWGYIGKLKNIFIVILRRVVFGILGGAVIVNIRKKYLKMLEKKNDKRINK